MNITDLIERYNKQLNDSLTQYNEDLLSAKEYLESNLMLTLSYINVADNLKDIYEK